MRRFFAENNSQQKEQFFEKYTTGFSRLAKVKTPWTYHDSKNSVTLKASFEIRNMLNLSGNYAAFDLPWLRSIADNIPAVNDRQTPLWFNSQTHIIRNIRIILPDNYTFAVPSSKDIDRNISNICKFTYISEIMKNVIEINSQLQIEPGLIFPENAAALVQLKKLVNSPALTCVFLQKN